MTALEVALAFIGRKWSPIPVPHRQKFPTVHKDWPDLRITAETAARFFNGGFLNVSVLLGKPSGDLTDADLDCPEALALAPRFLPPTESVFGRPGKATRTASTSAEPKTVSLRTPSPRK